MRPFCANEKCVLHAHQAENEQVVADIQLPDGEVRRYSRGWLLVKATGWPYPLCECCATALNAMRSDGEHLNRGLAVPIERDVSSLRPFCSIPKCFLFDLEVPADQPYVDVGLPTGTVLRYSRDWLVNRKEARRFSLCESCGNVLAIIRGDGEGLDIDAGQHVQAELVAPDGQVVRAEGPEPAEGDIQAPTIYPH